MNKEIIYTEHYALIVSDEEIKEGDFNVPSDFDRTSDISMTSKEDLEVVNDKFNGYKKIIAHRPLTNAPILEGVPLLPEFKQEDNADKLAKESYSEEGWDEPWRKMKRDRQVAFKVGYNKAKETYKYTEEDLKNAFYNGWLYRGEKQYQYPKALNEFIQSLQQPKRPKYFEISYSLSTKVNIEGDHIKEPRIITNPQGQTELVGECIYE
jgi:hypothetical protein